MIKGILRAVQHGKAAPITRLLHTGQVYRTTSGGGARVVDKYSEKEKTHSEIETKKTEKRGSAVPLHEEGYPLKLDALLS